MPRERLSDDFWIEHDRQFAAEQRRAEAEHRRHRRIEAALALVVPAAFALIFGHAAACDLVAGWLR
ncbi:MAG TPA: hypothetical protein VGW34_03235 [Allosphingosinicella sp.]|nr:hypothetical protein [Allosphingosinicella sp.]